MRLLQELGGIRRTRRGEATRRTRRGGAGGGCWVGRSGLGRRRWSRSGRCHRSSPALQRNTESVQGLGVARAWGLGFEGWSAGVWGLLGSSQESVGVPFKARNMTILKQGFFHK